MKDDIIKGINQNKDKIELRKKLIAFKNLGGSQREAHKILAEIRNEFKNDGIKEDIILALLDFACGWCQIKFKIWEDVKVFYSEQDELSKKNIVIEEDENSIWVYLTNPNESKIEKDCFLGSRYKIESNLDKNKHKQTPPSMIKEFSTEKSFLERISHNDITVNWFQKGNVLIKVKEIPFLFFHYEEIKGFSKSISKDGMFGNTWNEIKYREILK
jgi:hypothetical protein